MRQVDFEHGSVGRNMLQSAVPMLVAQLFALLYNIVDRIFLGRIPGEGTMALAGVGLCFPLVILTIGFANLFGTGGAPLFSIALGAKDRESAKHIQTTAFLLLSGAALIITAVGLLFSRPFLLLFGGVLLRLFSGDAAVVENFQQPDFKKVYDTAKFGTNGYDVFLSGAQSLLRIENPNAATDRELILFRDSFGSSMVPLLVQDYAKVTLVDTRYISSELLYQFLDFHGQDVLILYSTTLINGASILQ